MKAKSPIAGKPNRTSQITAGSPSSIQTAAWNVRGKRATKHRLSFRIVCVFSERWRLSGDKNQWVLEHYTAPKWRQAAFVGSDKLVLMRVLKDKGVNVLPDSKRILDCLPDRFLDWREQQLATLEKLENDKGVVEPATPMAAEA